MKSLTFNIVYIRNTVELLLPLLKSLLENSECEFRLVSNNCSEEEQELLKSFVDTHPRTCFYSLKTSNTLLHHEVLHQLLELETAPYFAFMDSDIIATSNFDTKLLNALGSNDAVFSGLPIWHEIHEKKMPQNFKIMGGRFYQSHNDFLLGLSYIAIYQTDSLKNFINKFGIGFEKLYWRQIPENHQNTLAQSGLRKHLYDTAKVLNILWQNEGAKMTFIDMPELIHLGGVSGSDNQENWFGKVRHDLNRVIPSFASSSIKSLLRVSDGISIRERIDIEKLVKKRRISGQIARQLLKGQTPGIVNIKTSSLPDEVSNNIQSAVQRVSSIAKKYYSS